MTPIPAPQQAIQVVQGEFMVSDRPGTVLSTVLGSCVAACLWDAERGIGGMNHFLLAQAQGHSGAGDIRYGVHAMEVLINALLRAGARRDRLRAKLFGGAKIAANLRDIGASNADFARQFLQTETIPCLAESLGGTQARRVTFEPVTGRARQLLIPNTVVDETPRQPPAPPRPVAPDIVLF
ncbi:chemotaxis protein CheD [Rhodobacter sp. Har01]|uniref:chemotaxis protein CheD n=1 Tax=Rhodobacter sp. Har01 TaxID=2883999 RepID=UPI001D07A4BC|nr:chemotaxis protein CheD [Rhodobacter sp. Har01]MCB6176776.1 chemotaxis protein CheD [Rhodobacter sp. Har01]